jgi:hypothetical protein
MVVWSVSVRSDGGQPGRTRGGRPSWRAHDRLRPTMQAAWARARKNIRSQEVRDRDVSPATLAGHGPRDHLSRSLSTPRVVTRE